MEQTYEETVDLDPAAQAYDEEARAIWEDDDDHVDRRNACPNPSCQENHIDHLVWIDDDTVLCTTCNTQYSPPGSNYKGAQ